MKRSLLEFSDFVELGLIHKDITWLIQTRRKRWKMLLMTKDLERSFLL